MDRFQDILKRRLQQRGLAVHLDAAVVVHHAQQWLNAHVPHLTEHLHVTRYVDRVLYVVCEHSTVAHELQGTIPDLLTALADEEPAPSSVRVVRSESLAKPPLAP